MKTLLNKVTVAMERPYYDILTQLAERENRAKKNQLEYIIDYYANNVHKMGSILAKKPSKNG